MIVVDVRTKKDWETSKHKIPGAVRVELGDFNHWARKQSKNTMIVLYCACPHDATSIGLAKLLIRKGYTKVYVLKGGWEEWLKAKYPIEKKSSQA